MAKPSFYWYDYETFGIDPRADRIAQFAGIRTDMDFNIIDEPVDILCRATDDILPHPEACMVTGITPQSTLNNGLIEAEFIAKVHNEFAKPNTCVAGFNSIRFDDEFTRYSLYRNFYDPYAREWQNGCSRWDIIDLVRATRALRPEGINWPVDDQGVATNRLELITRENNISHESAHDALSDVYATIAVAKLIKEKQPRLFDFVLNNKNKQAITKLLNLFQPQPVLHSSGMYPGTICNTAMVYPLAQHPTNKNGIIVFDLRYSPDDLLTFDADKIIERLYTPRDQLDEGDERIPLKVVHINKCPVIAPLNTLNHEAAERLQMDKTLHLQHLEQLKSAAGLNAAGLKQKLEQVYKHNPFEDESDPDKSLYSGGFFSPDDRQRMDQIRELPVDKLASADFNFKDPRIPEMLFRYRARNYPESLNQEEKARWDDYRRQTLTQKNSEKDFDYASFQADLKTQMERADLSSSQIEMLDSLKDWGEKLAKELGIVSD